ncbi:von Willebrand factor A domain-containing protein 7-like [Argopecten irradians]|uniref:von Willebrand factor A domain-containing protein 7-like n=1 Tax=Argopecten irradians TaxID=31199 RepID=UPI003722FC32
MVKFLLFCFWSILTSRTLAFKPTVGQGDDPSMYTHESITLDGVDSAAAEYLTSTGQVNTSTATARDVVKGYFGSDTNGYQDYQARSKEFAAAVMRVYRTYRNDPDYTVNSERIAEADDLVQATRLEIDSILSQGPLDDSAMNPLIDKVGKCLMVIQSFYSNTNWVEMMVNGKESFLNFGTLNAFNVIVATSGTVTCRNCDDSLPNGCSNNLLVHDRLTSGYLYGQLHYQKPTANPFAVEGKCSHGGVNDAGRNTAATGGINKETPDWNWSPHAHLHNISGQTAVKATAAFFMDPAAGILRGVDQAVMTAIFKIKKKVSHVPAMGFVIDVTGSMANDIRSVKETLIKTLNTVIGTPNQPTKYVLSTFSDPANLTTVATTTDGNEMIRWIERLTVDGGGDCPEFAISGVLAAVRASDPFAVVYVATDADAKDDNMTSVAIQEANAKNITLKFILTGNCSGSAWRRRDVHFDANDDSHHRSVRSVFDDLAHSTGGDVYNVAHSEVTATLDHVLEKDFPSSEAIIDYFVLATSDPDTVNVTVDSEAAVLVITIKGPYSLAHASLALPNGTAESFSSKQATQYYSSHTITMSIQSPARGIWKLTRRVSSLWTVNVTASTYLDIDSQLKETDTFGISYVVDRNPIVGKNYTLQVLVSNLNSSSSSFRLHLLDDQGADLYSHPVDLVFSPSKITGYMPIVTPNKDFYVQLSGVDPNGFQFKRMSRKLTKPVGVDLFVPPILGNLDINVNHNITYTLSNLGSTDQTYTVSITDDKGRVQSPTSQQQTVPAGNSTTGYFQIASPTELEAVTYTISVKLSGTTSVLQSSRNSVMFAGAVCSSQVTQKCRQSYTGSNCTLYTWSATSVFSFDVSTYVNVTNVSVAIDPTNGKRLHVTGTCCQKDFTVNAKPSAGSGCVTSDGVVAADNEEVAAIPFVVTDAGSSGIQTNTSGPHRTSVPVPETKSNTGLIVGLVIGCSVGVVAMVTGVITYKVYKGKRNQVKMFKTEYPARQEMVVKPQFDHRSLEL